MATYALYIRCKSDAAFSRGDGVAGLVDAEVQHDEYGCPFLGGRGLKGILVQECADILAALPETKLDRWAAAALLLFGRPGSGHGDNAALTIGDAQLPADLRLALATDVAAAKLTRGDVLESLTTIRRQTAMADGVPKENTLRTLRVLLRETPLLADLMFDPAPTADALALLAACVKALRRAGSHRNRGLGRITATLLEDGQPATDLHFIRFQQEVLQ